MSFSPHWAATIDDFTSDTFSPVTAVPKGDAVMTVAAESGLLNQVVAA